MEKQEMEGNGNGNGNGKLKWKLLHGECESYKGTSYSPHIFR